jgi:hypothetical protein
MLRDKSGGKSKGVQKREGRIDLVDQTQGRL